MSNFVRPILIDLARTVVRQRSKVRTQMNERILKEKIKTADKKFAKSIQKVIDKMSVKYQL